MTHDDGAAHSPPSLRQLFLNSSDLEKLAPLILPIVSTRVAIAALSCKMDWVSVFPTIKGKKQ